MRIRKLLAQVIAVSGALAFAQPQAGFNAVEAPGAQYQSLQELWSASSAILEILVTSIEGIGRRPT